MTVEAWTITPPYTISGTGPYQISHPYVAGAIRAYVQLDTDRLELNGTEFAVSPEASETTGNLTLSPTVASDYAGRQLIIDRMTPDEQGWVAVLGEREAGLAAQLDRTTQSIQELRARGAGALRIRGQLEPFDWPEGTVPILLDGKVQGGPTADAIAGAQAQAIAANQARLEAEAAAAAAEAKENSMLAARGLWATDTLYKPSDIARQGTTQYRCLVPHTSGVFATDLSAGYWEDWLKDGAPGPGTGDMQKSENLSGLTNYPLARATLGISGQGDLLVRATASTTHAAGTNAQGQAPIAATARLVYIDAVATLSGVTLPEIATGQNGVDILVALHGSSTAPVNVYPAAGAGFEGMPLAEPILLQPGWRLHVFRRFLNQWAWTLLPRDVPSYVDARGRNLLSDKIVSIAPVAQLDFTEFNHAAYRYTEFEFDDVLPTSNNTLLCMRTSVDGINYASGGSDYSWGAAVPQNGNTQSFAADVQMVVAGLSTLGIGNTSPTDTGVHGKLRVQKAAAGRLRFRSELIFDNTGQSRAMLATGGRLASQTTLGIRFYFLAGNIAVGSRIRMYGVN